jgi:hypothetical protein
MGDDSMAHAPGTIRDAILAYLSEVNRDASLAEIKQYVSDKIGTVSSSSVRSYLNLNVPDTFERTGRGRYRLKKKPNRAGLMQLLRRLPAILELFWATASRGF